MTKHYLSPLFSPQSILLFSENADAAEGHVSRGRLLAQQMSDGGFTGPMFSLNIDQSRTLDELAESRADLAIIALPMEKLAAALDIAGSIQCQAALILAGGITQTLASVLHAIARQHNIYLLGPNCMGFQRPQLGINASLLGPLAHTGSLALVSQSGALTASILDWAASNAVGFSAVVSIGANSAVDLTQVLDFLTEDRNTRNIVVYLEGIRDARRFMSALRAAANSKPVVVLKSGRKPAGSTAALTHSGAIVGSDEVFDAALRRAGVVRVRSIVQLFTAVKCLNSPYRPSGKRLAIITNGGGPGILAADWANELSMELASLSSQSVAALAPQLAPDATLHGLIDLAENASVEQYRAAVAACAANGKIDGVLAILSPTLGLDNAAAAQALADLQPGLGIPLITCWMGGKSVADARAILQAAAIPTFRTPEAAVDAFSSIASFQHNQELLHQTPPPMSQMDKPDLEGARLLIESILSERRKVLTEMESKALLSAFHVPVTKTMLARSANEAILIANQFGYPVALKIDSADISHKSEVQGVALDVQNATGVRNTWQDMMAMVARIRPDARINGVTVQNMCGMPHGREMYIGVTTDDLFGPVISFGGGGTMIEVLADRAVELPPLNQFIAQRLIDRVRSAETLGVWRGAPPADRDALEQMLLRVSEMVCALPQIRAMDINPVIVDASGALAVDARIVIGNAPETVGDYPHLAILPYPSSYEREWPIPDGRCYVIRSIHPDDADMLQEFSRNLSPESRYFRFVSSIRELSPRMLARMTLIDYDREMALVAIISERTPDAEGGFVETKRMIGVSRYITNADRSTCEFSLVVADDFSGQGLGSRLMLSIMDVARSKGFVKIEGLVLTKNKPMLKLMKSLGFENKPYPDDPDFRLCVKPL
jgi:acetyltransferase